MSALLALVLAQVVAPEATLPAVAAWPTVTTWTDGVRERRATLEGSTVATPSADDALGKRLVALGAAPLTTHARLTLWRVGDASAVLAREPAALPVYRDDKSAKRRVPLDAVVVVPAPGTSAEAVRARVGGAVHNDVVRVACSARDASALAQRLTKSPGVSWAQPSWWLAVVSK